MKVKIWTKKTKAQQVKTIMKNRIPRWQVEAL